MFSNVLEACSTHVGFSQEYYALLEYATPVVSMYEMSREGLAGLSKDEMMHQVRNFKDLLDQVLSHSPLSRSLYMFRLVFFESRQSVFTSKIFYLFHCIY